MNLAPRTGLRRLAWAALAVPLVLAGCAGPLSSDAGGRPKVVASIYPLAYLAEQIAGDHAQVVTLTSPGVEPHDLELNVHQTAEVVDADLMVYETGLQPAVDEAVAQNGVARVVEVSATVPLRPLGPGHDDESDAEHAEHTEEAVDPHFWLDPELMSRVADRVERQLVEIDPEHAADYAARLQAFRHEMTRLDRDYRTGLADCRLHTVVVSHDAFGYLRKYGLHFESIAGLSPDSEPSAAQLSRLGDLIRKEGISMVFTETLASPALADTLAHDLGIEAAVLDPIEGLGDATATEDYVSLMRSNLEKLRSANRCR